MVAEADTTTRRKPRKFLRFGTNTVLMTMGLVAALIASETNRYRHRSIVEQACGKDVADRIIYSTRFKNIDPKGLFASNLTKLIGPRWNQVVTSVVLYDEQIDARVIDSVRRLNHLHTVGFMGHGMGEKMDLTELRCDRLAKILSLRWAYFVNTNVDEATIESLRKAMPNTYVTGIEYSWGVP